MSRNLSFQKILLEVSWIHFQLSVTLRSAGAGLALQSVGAFITEASVSGRVGNLGTCWGPRLDSKPSTGGSSCSLWVSLFAWVTLSHGQSAQSLPVCAPDSQSIPAPALGSSETCWGSVEAEGSVCVVHTGDKDLFSNILYYSFLF